MQKPGDSRRYDALIVGLGLAGGLLARELASRGLRLLVLDNGAADSASRVAAGLINPVTGPRLVKTPMADELLPASLQTLRGLEKQLGAVFLHPMPLVRRFDSESMRERWRGRVREPGYRDYLKPDPLTPERLSPCAAPLGGFTQRRTGWLDTNSLLDSLTNWLRSNSALRLRAVDYCDVRLNGGNVDLGAITATRIIFCEGYRLGSNPWFDWLPLQPAKGEILTLTTRTELPQRILSAGRWLLPVGKHRFRFGATYGWNHIGTLASAAGRSHLLSDLAERFPELAARSELQEQRAGVRPGTPDRHPFVGMHPEHPSVGVFNGFGSKGSLAIPWYAHRFAEHLCTGTPLPPEADIRRWWRGTGPAADVGNEPARI